MFFNETDTNREFKFDARLSFLRTLKMRWQPAITKLPKAKTKGFCTLHRCI